ncbi:GntR family transcriptional regulator [Litoreibacter arenae]|uniref:Transcriptional regulator, GntR family n=1 Tax=Litoreibacter arenae DSM 19593 TaxID=1123360 RepID=S9S5Z6_9RHOB|nr:GntR family transcriptional regulator [Litoreibacter arenae]EPX81614.1 transcriptional regulator, GntR family [Litoreibacter arenae DSM 19593]
MYERQDSPAALPIYAQVSELLIREIASGRLADGARLPPERQLAATHQVTVRTLRKSLKILEEKGLLERIQGSGNYVRSNPAAQSIYSMFRIELLEGGGLPTAKFLDISEHTKPGDLPAFGSSPRGTRMRRLRFLNKKPAAVEEIWLDADSGTVDPAQVSDSLYRYYQMKLGFWITRAEDYVSIGKTPDWAPPEFGPQAGQMTGYIERLSWEQKPHPVEYSRTWFDTDIARYVQRLK